MSLNRVTSAGSSGPVAELSGSMPSGPQEQSLFFHDTWEEMTRHRRRQEGEAPYDHTLERVRFGSLLADSEVADLLLMARPVGEYIHIPSFRDGVEVYDRALIATANRGSVTLTGTTINRLY